jgi:hypothetical protein
VLFYHEQMSRGLRHNSRIADHPNRLEVEDFLPTMEITFQLSRCPLKGKLK